MDNFELNLLFKKKIINELLLKFDYINSLIKEKRIINDENNDNLVGYVTENQKKGSEILQRLKFIYYQFIYNFNDNVNNISNYIEKCLLNRNIDLENDIKLDFSFKNINNYSSSKKVKYDLEPKIEDKMTEEKSSLYSLFNNNDENNNNNDSQLTILNKEKRNIFLNLQQQENNLSDSFPFNKNSSKKIPKNNFKNEIKRSFPENKKHLKNLLGIKRKINFNKDINYE